MEPDRKQRTGGGWLRVARIDRGIRQLTSHLQKDENAEVHISHYQLRSF